MKFHVESWSPGYGASHDAERGPAEASSAKLDTNVEVDAKKWKPLDPARDARCPERVLLVDGVRRTDARLWIGEHPGLACSYAAGVVECVPGVARVADTKVERTIFTSAPEVSDVGTSPARYNARSIKNADESVLANQV